MKNIKQQPKLNRLFLAILMKFNDIIGEPFCGEFYNKHKD